MSGFELAINGGAPVRQRPWPTWPEWDDDTVRALAGVLESGRWSVTNPDPPGEVKEWVVSRELAAVYGHQYVVPVSTGGTALRLALIALGVRAGDYVAVPALTWAAVASSVVAIGAFPIPVDVAPDSLCMAPAALERTVLEHGERLSAAIVVHQNSAVADIDAIIGSCRRAGMAIIEDCSQAHGASVHGTPVGSLSDAAVYSFQQNKMVTCGEGGAVATSNEHTFSVLEQLRSVGRARVQDPSSDVQLMNIGKVIGESAVMSEFTAAILSDQLSRLRDQHDRRRRSVEEFSGELQSIDGIVPLCESPSGADVAYHKLTLRLEPSLELDAERFRVALAAELRREVGRVDPPLGTNPLLQLSAICDRLGAFTAETHIQRYHDDMIAVEVPVAREARGRCIYIRHDAFLAPESDDVGDISRALRKVLRNSMQLRSA